jgi:hypothetical protein
MMPKDSGSTPPPMPWITRATIMMTIEPVKAASTDPAVRAISATTSIRSLPHMSPRRPMMGVKIDADSR